MPINGAQESKNCICGERLHRRETPTERKNRRAHTEEKNWKNNKLKMLEFSMDEGHIIYNGTKKILHI
jgi:hypothetical protein